MRTFIAISSMFLLAIPAALIGYICAHIRLGFDAGYDAAIRDGDAACDKVVAWAEKQSEKEQTDGS